MKVICFLGNPGKKYQSTRHNAGFLCGDFLATQYSFSDWKEEKKAFGSVCNGVINGEKVFFLKPSTFMNLSGKSLSAMVQFYKVSTEDVVVIYDDKDMAFGKIRFRAQGSSGGQNGIKNIITTLGTDSIPRIKIGISTQHQSYFTDTSAFVLSSFTPEEKTYLDQEVFPQVQGVLEDILKET